MEALDVNTGAKKGDMKTTESLKVQALKIIKIAKNKIYGVLLV